MARFKRTDVYTMVEAQRMMPVFYHPDPEIVKSVMKACYHGGGRLFEFTNRGDFAHEVFAEVYKWASKEIPEMMIGVGSVIDAGTANFYMQMGANFIVSPTLKEEMAFSCNRRKVAWMPGCGSMTEISRAEELGAEVVKIFPGAAVGGPSFVKAVLGPSPWSNIMPTGGVEPTKENLTAWFQAGVFCVGMGSKLLTKDIIKNKEFDLLENTVRDTLKLIEEINA